MDLHKYTLQNRKVFRSINGNISFHTEGVHNNCIYKNESALGVERCIRDINAKCNSAKIKEGLHLLLLFLPQSSNETIKQEGEKWIKMCFRLLVSNDSRTRAAACYILIYILRTAECIPSLKTEIGKSIRVNYAAETSTGLINAGKECRQASYEFLYYFLKLYPGATLSQTSQLEKAMVAYLNKPISANNQQSISSAGKVYTCIRGADIKKLISLGHCSLDVLFENVVETEDYLVDRNHLLPLKELDNAIKVGNPIKKLFTAASIICNTMTFMESFLLHYPSGKINVCPRDLLNLPLRLLQVDQKSVAKLKGQENIHLTSILPSLFQRALSFIQSVILSIGDSLDLFYGVLFDQLRLMLNSISTPKRSEKKSKKEDKTSFQSDTIRTCIYQTLHALVEASGGTYDMSLEIAESLVDDITPSKEGISLRSIRGGAITKVTVHRKSKKRIYAASATDKANNEEVLSCRTANGPNTKAALDLASKWIEVGHHSISLRAYELVSRCLTSMSPLLSVAAYCITEVRHSYFEALISLALHPHPGCPQSYSTLTHAFSVGITESDEKVSSICQRGLSILSFILSNPQISIFQDCVGQSRAQKEQEDERIVKENEDYEILVTSDEESEGEIEEIPNEAVVENGEHVEESNLKEMNVEESGADLPSVLIDISEDEDNAGSSQQEIYLSSDEIDDELPIEIVAAEQSINMNVEDNVEDNLNVEDNEDTNKRKIDEEEQDGKTKKQKSKPAARRTSPRKKQSDKDGKELGDSEDLLDTLPDAAAMVGDSNLMDMLSCFVDADPDSDS